VRDTRGEGGSRLILPKDQQFAEQETDESKKKQAKFASRQRMQPQVQRWQCQQVRHWHVRNEQKSQCPARVLVTSQVPARVLVCAPSALENISRAMRDLLGATAPGFAGAIEGLVALAAGVLGPVSDLLRERERESARSDKRTRARKE